MNQFKVGDKVKYKENHKKVAGSNKHSPDKIYTIRGINQNTENVFFDESVHACWIERLELVNNNRHKHADLMIAYANDKSLKFQYREDESWKWTDCTIAPIFSETIQYRIKPKTELVKVYNWTMQAMNGYLFISSAKFADTEAVKRAYNLIDKLPSTEEEIEIQI